MRVSSRRRMAELSFSPAASSAWYRFSCGAVRSPTSPPTPRNSSHSTRFSSRFCSRCANVRHISSPSSLQTRFMSTNQRKKVRWALWSALRGTSCICKNCCLSMRHRRSLASFLGTMLRSHTVLDSRYLRSTISRKMRRARAPNLASITESMICWRRVEVRSSMSGLKVAPSAPPPKILHTALKLSWQSVLSASLVASHVRCVLCSSPESLCSLSRASTDAAGMWLLAMLTGCSDLRRTVLSKRLISEAVLGP
mmetsp:Transcript_9693/g.22394  ORF Transcript_9693/g.22394 Transcript_9693/m.22394 type:complete len:253 (+) Transcript_9693:435-1193(+)